MTRALKNSSSGLNSPPVRRIDFFDVPLKYYVIMFIIPFLRGTEYWRQHGDERS
ncbi:hypothetical protein DCCM_0979 [Desulfocucumis palustris]|uniref:Uncharacterized protein n=1 Tax=Desulfocucumis palustris TaxID=1898651 RepID=A0A2L2XAU7_9FIRM|nr:hypothetical protein DCCM_0979 [Desulfocucumis palustris]